MKSPSVTVQITGYSLTVHATWAGTGVSLPGVSLNLAGSTMTTGPDGNAVFKAVAPGYYTVYGSLAGYDQAHVSVQLSGDQTVTLVMQRSAVSYPLAISATASPSSPATGQTVTFSAKGSGGSGNYVFTWTFDDGSILEGTSVPHAFGTVGTHATQVMMTDTSNGQQFTALIDVTVIPSNPRLAQVTVTTTSSFDGSVWPGVKVVLGPQTQYTNDSGQAIFNIDPGTYGLDVSTPGAVPYSTTLDVAGDISLPIVLTITMI